MAFQWLWAWVVPFGFAYTQGEDWVIDPQKAQVATLWLTSSIGVKCISWGDYSVFFNPRCCVGFMVSSYSVNQMEAEKNFIQRFGWVSIESFPLEADESNFGWSRDSKMFPAQITSWILVWMLLFLRFPWPVFRELKMILLTVLLPIVLKLSFLSFGIFRAG